MAGNSMQPQQTPAGNGGAVIRAILGSGGFIACVLLLAGVAAAFHVLTMKMTVIKEAVPLKLPLDQMNKAALSPYKFERAQQIPVETVDRLGTKEYIQWILSPPPQTPLNRAMPISFFVTYYTGQPDQVPHVPEECYVGSGFKEARSGAPEIPVPALGEDVRVPFTLLEFERDDLLGQKQYTMVMYTFKANTQFTATRDGVRAVLGDPSETHAYYSKLELSTALPSNQVISREAFLETMTEFIQVALPVLVRDHWPEDAALAQTRQAAGEAPGMPTTSR